jgi:inorganic pyrophosphatase
MSINDVTAGKHVPHEFNVIIEIPMRADPVEMRLRQIQHFFEHYKDLEPGKWVKVMGWTGVDVAHAEIMNGIKRYDAEKPSSLTL